MMWRWRYFLAAAIFAGYVLIRANAPVPAVLAGIAGIGLFMWRRGRIHSF